MTKALVRLCGSEGWAVPFVVCMHQFKLSGFVELFENCNLCPSLEAL